MIKHIIVKEDGTEISSGVGTKNAIMSIKTTDAVNVGEELTLGSAFANMLEATLISKENDLTFSAGEEITLYKVDDNGNRKKHGIYILERPTRIKSNTIRITGYDRMIKLDQDLSTWINSQNVWPQKLLSFAHAVCKACGVSLVNTTIPNEDMPVPYIQKAGITGRELMRWIGEACGKFCRATADGEIEFAWYKTTSEQITPSGEHHYFTNSLSYEAYEVMDVDAVKIRLSSSSTGALWPTATAENPYVIESNPVVMGSITGALADYLYVIHSVISGATYTPFKVSIPATLDIVPGDIITVTDIHGKTFTGWVMSKTTTGQRDTIECTGSQNRSSSTAKNNQPVQVLASQAADTALASETQDDVWNKLTNNGAVQGIFYQNDRWFINCSVAQVMNINASNITTGTLNANRINADQLMAKDISMSGTLMQTTQVFFEPGAEDLQTMYDLISSTGSYTEEQLAMYDFDGDGYVSLADYMTAYSAMVGVKSLSTWSGAVKSTATVIVDLKNPKQAIRITGTNMWGRQVTHSLGLNTVFSDGNTADTFNLMLKQSDAYKDLERRLSALE